jgi:peptidoglycan/xylan/chitin deacetylase (PgdA/CDA1 family)
MTIGTLKDWSFGTLKHLGVSGTLARSRWRRSRLLILCYHGVALDDEHTWAPGLYISPDRLRRRLEILRDTGCTVLPLAEGLERLYAGDLPERAVVLTFDDGYHDFMARAWPLLQAFGYPATVYLTTSRVYNNLPIVNLFLSYVLWKARERVLDGRGIAGLRGTYVLRSPEQRQQVLADMYDEWRDDTAVEKDSVVRDIVGRLGLDYAALLASRVLTLMRPDDVTRLSGEGVDFQLHTHVHQTPDDAGAFVRDVLRNRERIEALTGVRPVHLCYPSGNYRRQYLPALRASGVLSATTCNPGIAGRTTDPLVLPRFVDTSSVSDIVFESWITGLAPYLPRRTTRGGDKLPPQPARDVHHA